MEGSRSDPSSTRIAVVTGGNKGCGLEVCRQLAGSGVTVVLTARDETRGTAAVEKLRGRGLSNVVFHQLDITDAPSIARLADFLKARFGKLDILVNNAGFVGLEYIQDHINGTSTTSEKFDGMEMNQRLELLMKLCLRESCDAGKECMRINYHGTKQVIRAFLPLLLASSDGRIVNVSSMLGQLRFFGSEVLKRELDDVESLTEERLDEVAAMFVEDLEAGALEARGWPVSFSPAYTVSKATLNAYSRILARKHPELRINCVHPGFVKTDMTVNFGMLTPEEGGRRVVDVALLPAGEPTGAYFEERQQRRSCDTYILCFIRYQRIKTCTFTKQLNYTHLRQAQFNRRKFRNTQCYTPTSHKLSPLLDDASTQVLELLLTDPISRAPPFHLLQSLARCLHPIDVLSHDVSTLDVVLVRRDTPHR